RADCRTDQRDVEGSAEPTKSKTELAILGVTNQEVHLHSYRMKLLYNFGEGTSSVRPFLTAGLGHEKFAVDNFGEACKVGWNAGGGLRFGLSKHWNLRADGRYVSMKVEDDINKTQKNTEAT